MLTSPSKFLTGTIFLHAHLQAVYNNCVKFHFNPMNRLGGVALTSPSLHTERISEYKLNYPPPPPPLPNFGQQPYSFMHICR